MKSLIKDPLLRFKELEKISEHLCLCLILNKKLKNHGPITALYILNACLSYAWLSMVQPSDNSLS